MVGIFDTHCHLISDEYNKEETTDILENGKLANIENICNVGYTLETSKLAVNQALKHKSVWASVGIHPTDVGKHCETDLDELDNLMHNEQVIAVGEIGLDYYHKYTTAELQKQWFKKQLKLAKKHNLPVLIHCRDAFTDCYNILKQEKINRGIMHCYNGDLQTAKKFIELGFYISFAGNVTFKNATDLQLVAKNLPLEKIVVETDAPYLTPSPYRGQKNYPHHIVHTLKKIAEIKKVDFESLVKITSTNAKKVFNLK